MRNLIILLTACTLSTIGLRAGGASIALAAPPMGLPEDEARLTSAINSARAGNGLAPLHNDPILTDLARHRAEDQASRGYFSHTTPEGQTVFDLLASAGVSYSRAGENLAESSARDPVSIAIAGFMRSAVHRDNLLQPGYSRMGVGAVLGSGGMEFLAVIFSD